MPVIDVATGEKPPAPEGASRQVVVWRPPNERPDVLALRQREERLATMKHDAQLALVEARLKLQQARSIVANLVCKEMEKYAKLAEHSDFANSPGPLSPELILRWAEFVSKEDRLDSGKATEHIAHVVAPAIDFSKLSQEERDAWRALAIKGGAPDE